MSLLTGYCQLEILRMPEKETCESEVLVRDAERVIREVLETLPVIHQEAIIRRFFMLQSSEECAEAMGICRQEVWMREAKALRMLRHPTRIRPLEEISETYGLVSYE